MVTRFHNNTDIYCECEGKCHNLSTCQNYATGYIYFEGFGTWAMCAECAVRITIPHKDLGPLSAFEKGQPVINK